MSDFFSFSLLSASTASNYYFFNLSFFIFVYRSDEVRLSLNLSFVSLFRVCSFRYFIRLLLFFISFFLFLFVFPTKYSFVFPCNIFKPFVTYFSRSLLLSTDTSKQEHLQLFIFQVLYIFSRDYLFIHLFIFLFTASLLVLFFLFFLFKYFLSRNAETQGS